MISLKSNASKSSAGGALKSGAAAKTTAIFGGSVDDFDGLGCFLQDRTFFPMHTEDGEFFQPIG